MYLFVKPCFEVSLTHLWFANPLTMQCSDFGALKIKYFYRPFAKSEGLNYLKSLVKKNPLQKRSIKS